jgi:hypothetical protein
VKGTGPDIVPIKPFVVGVVVVGVVVVVVLLLLLLLLLFSRSSGLHVIIDSSS